MKTKNRVVAGIVALAILLGMGVGNASAQENPDGSNSQASFAITVQIMVVAEQVVASATDSTEAALAYDLLLVAQLTFTFLELYSEVYPASADDSTETFGYADFFQDAIGTSFAISELAEQLAGAGSPLGQELVQASQLLNSTLLAARFATTPSEG